MGRTVIKNKRFLRFNGVDTAVSFASYVPPVSGFSLAVWWKPKLVSSANSRLVDWQDAGPLDGFTLNIATANSQQVRFVANSHDGTVLASIVSNNVKLWGWNLIVLTYENNLAKLFVNNVQQGSTDTSITITAPTNGLKIGRRADAAANFCKGIMRDFMIFPRVLTTVEMSDLYNSDTIPTSPDVYLKMDELSGVTLADSSGNGRVGTVSGVAQYGLETKERNILPQYANAVSFSPATTALISVPDAEILRPEVTKKFSWICRVKLNSTSNNVLPRLIEKGSHYTSIMGDQSNGSANYHALEIENVDTNPTELWGTTKIPLNRWVYLGVTFDDGICTLYMDGFKDPVRLIGQDYEDMSDSTTYPLVFGNRRTNNRNLDGIMQGVRMYNVVLTEEEMFQLSRGENIVRGLVGKWNLDEGTGTTIADSSGNGNDGTLTDGVWKTGILTSRTTTTNRAPVGLLSDHIKSLDGLVAYYPMDETEGVVATDVKSGLNGNIINLNRLPNGNMEGNYGWADYNLVGGDTQARSSEIIHGGSYSRKLVLAGSNRGAMGPTLNVVSGHTYRVSCWVYTVAGSTGKARIRRNSAKINFTITGTTTGAWEHLTVDVVAGSSGSEAMRLESSGAGTFYFDDASIIDLADSDNTITNAAGLVGKAYQFDGVNDYVELPQNAVFSPATTGKFTMFAIIKPDVLDFTDGTAMGGDEGSAVHIIGKNESSASEFTLRMYNKTGSSRPNRISFYVFEAIGGEGIGGYFQDTLVAGQPIFITATVDGKYVSIYKNGVLRQATDYTIDQGYAGPLTLSATITPVRVGSVSLAATDKGWFQGTVQHLGFLNRAMTADEIAVLNKKVQTGLASNRTSI